MDGVPLIIDFNERGSGRRAPSEDERRWRATRAGRPTG
jgi:hypothetical protein